jgi:catechol 2,3-dioxygenase-like lactoylglutathione lyase family enzyme/ketosteroid isomerase-like protein
MSQSLALISLVVPDYDEAIRYYIDVLGFELIEDREEPEQSKRFVVVRPRGRGTTGLVLGRASNPDQASRIGNQTGGRVFLFLHTDNFDRDYDAYRAKGVEFIRPPADMPYGRVAVFRDRYGNLWDLVQPPVDSDGKLETIRALYDTIQGHRTDRDIASFYTDDVIQDEFPNRFVPAGIRRDLNAIIEASKRGKGVMAKQALEIVNTVSSGDTVVVEAQWTGTTAIDIGPIPAGTVMRARFAQFYEFREGRIAVMRNYDCFEPW